MWFHNRSSTMTRSRMFLLLSVLLSSAVVVRSDYPPPSEEGHSYYSSSYGDGSSPVSTRFGTGGGPSFIGDWGTRDWTGLHTHNQPKCLDIPSNLTLCRDIGYGQMRLPNLLQHDTLKEVTQQAFTWVRLTQAKCHPDTQIFLCSLFAPVCLDQPVSPCRSLCEAVKAGCESRMLQNGFPWPEMLRCDLFPSGTDLCIGIREQQETDEETEAACEACKAFDSYDSIMNTFCSSDFVIRAKVEQSLVTGSDLKVTISKKKKLFRSALPKIKELREGVVFIEGGSSCDCPRLDTINGRQSNDGHVIIAGNRTGDRLVLSSIQGVDVLQRSKVLRRALRDIRKKSACQERGGSEQTGSEVQQPEVGKKKPGKKQTTAPTTGAAVQTTSGFGGSGKGIKNPGGKHPGKGGASKKLKGSVTQRPKAKGKAKATKERDRKQVLVPATTPRTPKKSVNRKNN